MQEVEKGLQRIRGIGEVLAKRLVEAGYDSYAKVAAAGTEGLSAIRGMNPRAIPAILAQAAELEGAAEAPAEDRRQKVLAAVEQLRRRIEALAAEANGSFAGQDPGSKGKRLEKAIFRLLDQLERIAGAPERRPRKTLRRLQKANGRLEKAEGSDPPAVTRQLKKTRRRLKKVAR